MAKWAIIVPIILSNGLEKRYDMGSNTIEVQIAVAKVGKYASSESGDTVEMIERPRGGVSVVVADGQMSGKGAKRISNLVVRKTLSLLAEGVRDGAAARAAHDYLYAHRSGAVQATLNIVSVDLDSKTIVISRNSHCPVIMMSQNGLEVIDEPSSPVGIYPYTKPHITEVPISPFLCVVVFTDGLLSAGQRRGQHMDIAAAVMDRQRRDLHQNAQTLADDLLNEGVTLDGGRPSDDISVLVVNIVPSDVTSDRELVRRMNVSFPVRSGWYVPPEDQRVTVEK